MFTAEITISMKNLDFTATDFSSLEKKYNEIRELV
jgi:hypothetical protein